jgi:hypothetical protein
VAIVHLALLCATRACDGAQPAVAHETEDSTKSLISQGVPVGWGDHRHVKAEKGADARVPVGWRIGDAGARLFLGE